MLWRTVVLSLLVHAVLLWGWVPRVDWQRKDSHPWGDPTGQLRVRIVEPSIPAAPAAPPPAAVRPVPPRQQPAAAPSPRVPSPAAAASSAAPPPSILTAPVPAPNAASVPVPPPRTSPDSDFSAQLEARRRARGEQPSTPAQSAAPAAPPAVPAEDDAARRNRIIAANMAALQSQPRAEQQRGGGVFDVRRLGTVDAEFMFYGWRAETGRRAPQMVEVRLGQNADMRIAVVRRMIGIIREHEREDFDWYSARTGRTLRLSARQADNAMLEAFLLSEFF